MQAPGFRFLAGCRKRRLGSAVSILSLRFLSGLLLFIIATFCVKISLHLYVFCLLVVDA